MAPAVVHTILMVGGIGGGSGCALCLSCPAQEKGSKQEAGFFEYWGELSIHGLHILLDIR